MRTKWEILEARLTELEKEVAKAKHYMEGLENTPCGLTCHGCNTELPTEADFAKHFTISDERFLNLGECPNV